MFQYRETTNSIFILDVHTRVHTSAYRMVDAIQNWSNKINVTCFHSTG